MSSDCSRQGRSKRTPRCTGFLQHGLLFRPILQRLPFLCIISCRPIAESLQEIFNIHQVRWYGVRGELDDPGPIETTHYPDGFEELRRTLEVPFRGAVFLVAGAFGKVYCQWIKGGGESKIEPMSIAILGATQDGSATR